VRIRQLRGLGSREDSEAARTRKPRGRRGCENEEAARTQVAAGAERPQRLLRRKSSPCKVSVKSGGCRAKLRIVMCPRSTAGIRTGVGCNHVSTESEVYYERYTDRKFSLLDILFSWAL
jgi:hypothetical protein